MSRSNPTSYHFSITWRTIDFTGEAKIYPGDPGRVSGPPEKCYPPEADEVEITALWCGGFDALPLMDIEQAAEEITAIVEKKFNDDYEPPCEDYEPDEPPDMTDVEADADTLKSAGWGTDEDYGHYGDDDGY